MLTATRPRPAGLARRGLASFVDLSILGCGGLVVLLPVVFVLGLRCFSGQCTGQGRETALRAAWYLASLLMPGAYFVSSWWRLGNGRTFGMRAVRIRLIQLSGQPPSLVQALVRIVVLTALVLPRGFWEFSELTWPAVILGQLQAVGFIALVLSILLSGDRRGIHDRLAGTMLVEDRET